MDATNQPQPPVVLIAPAMAVGSRYYRPVIEEFRRHGWDAQALTRRGFELDAPAASREHDWSYADEIDDIAGAVSAARDAHPGRPILLLGHSLGGQLVAGHEVTQPNVDGLITVGGAFPHHRTYSYRGGGIWMFGALVIPALTTLFGYVPKPAFGAPGARTLMREWARIVVTGRPPFPTSSKVATPSLVISLGDDRLAPRRAVEYFAHRMFDPAAMTRWHYATSDVAPGDSNDHLGWARAPRGVVDHVVAWWGER